MPFRLLALPLELRRQIYRYAVYDAYSLPGQAVLQPRSWLLRSLRRTCRQIHHELLSEIGMLVRLFLEVNVFQYEGPLQLTQTVFFTPSVVLNWIRNIHIEHYWVPGHRWNFTAAELAWVNMLPNLRCLRLSAGSIDGLPGNRAIQWMNTSRAIRQERYRFLVNQFLRQLQPLPRQLILEVCSEVQAYQPALPATDWVPRGTVFVTLRYEVIDIVAWAEVAIEEREDRW